VDFTGAAFNVWEDAKEQRLHDMIWFKNKYLVNKRTSELHQI
jgi:hypothetical protein